MSRFVRPETATLTLANGDTLTVRRRLTNGEQRAAYARMYLAGADGRLRTNPLETGIALASAFLIDWSLTDDDGARVEIRGLPIDELRAVLDNLEPESFAEIKDAIEAHETAMAQERAAQKKTDGPNKSGPTS